MQQTIENIYSLFLNTNKISIDSRTIEQDDLFIAIKGDNFDGNKFAKKAIDNGAAYAIVDNPSIIDQNENFILVDDSLITLQQLASYHRDQFKIPVLAITGSNGKTTTKELIAAIFSKQYHVHYTKGNFNNHIGVPLTLLSMPLNCEIAIIEMGANHLKEIELLCQIAKPTHGLITNIGKAHLEGFGNVEGVKKAKGELFDYLKNTGGFGFINIADQKINAISQNMKIIPFSQVEVFDENKSVYQYQLKSSISKINCIYMDHNNSEIHSIYSPLFGHYNFLNIIASTTIARYFKVTTENIISAIQHYEPKNNRSQKIEIDSNSILLDAYNANPSSMEVAINNFAEMDAEQKIVVLGDMLELGDYSNQEHQKIYQLALSKEFNHMILIGNAFSKIKHNAIHFEDVNQLKIWWNQQEFKDFNILIKGSRGIQLEKLIAL